MAKYYRSEDEAPIVESPMADEEGQVIAATATTEPDLPPAGPVEPIAEVESTREPEADPTVPKQRFGFRQEGEEIEATPEAVPTEAPAAPMDTPAAGTSADGAPADAPAPEAVPAEAPATPLDAPADASVADVPAAAKMVPPLPEADVAPMAPKEDEEPVAPPVAPEVEAPTAPAEEPVNDAPVQRFRQEDGEELSVVATEEPRMPADTESEECPETGDEYVTKDIKEPINPVIEQEDDLTAAPEEDGALGEGEEAGGTEPTEVETHNDITAIEPEVAEDQEAAENEIEEATMRFSQAFHMEDDATEIPAEVESDNGDQNVDVSVQVRKDDGDAHGDAPKQRFGFRQEGDQLPPPPKEITIKDGPAVHSEPSKEKLPPPPPDKGPVWDSMQNPSADENIETVSDVTKVDTEQPAEDDIVDAVVPDPIDPNAGNPDPEQCFRSMFNMGGEWM